MSETPRPPSAHYYDLAASAQAAGDTDLADRLRSYGHDAWLGDPQERKAFIDGHVQRITSSIQQLTQWGVEEAGRHSYLYHEGTVPHLPVGENEKAVNLYLGFRRVVDADVLNTVYARLGLVDERLKTNPAVESDEDTIIYKTQTSWGVKITEIQHKFDDGDILTELWAN